MVTYNRKLSKQRMKKKYEINKKKKKGKKLKYVIRVTNIYFPSNTIR